MKFNDMHNHLIRNPNHKLLIKIFWKKTNLFFVWLPTLKYLNLILKRQVNISSSYKLVMNNIVVIFQFRCLPLNFYCCLWFYGLWYEHKSGQWYHNTRELMKKKKQFNFQLTNLFVIYVYNIIIVKNLYNLYN